MRKRIASLIGCLVVSGVAFAAEEPSKSPGTQEKSGHAAMTPASKGMSASAKIKLATSAAPADIGRNATVVEPGEGGQMKELRAGTNGWVCMAEPEVMCLDKEWQAWVDAWVNKKDPQVNNVGVAYMLKGDKGTSNTDPYATARTPDNQWIVSPPHIMILTPDTKQLDALPTDPHNGGPWVMWKDTPYAHIMVPITPVPKGAAPAKPAAKN